MTWGEIHCDNYLGCVNKDSESCGMGCSEFKLAHDTDSEYCWCEPEIIEYDNGNKVIIHREENRNGTKI